MLQMPRWQVWTILIVCVSAFLVAAPTLMPQDLRDRINAWNVPTPILNLGLDLQGGSSLLLEVDLQGVYRDKLDNLRADVRKALTSAEPRITHTTRVSGPNQLQITLNEDQRGRADEAQRIIEDLGGGGGLLGGGTQTFELQRTGDGVFTVTFTEAYLTQIRTQTLAQSQEIVRRRIDELGTREPTIQSQGADRILVQVPGLQNPEQLKDILGQTAKLSFRWVRGTSPVAPDAPNPDPLAADILLEEGDNGAKLYWLVEKEVIVAGDNLVDAGQSFDQRTNEVVVTFQFDNTGARKFADATAPQNVGRLFAIVLDDKVMSAPRINEPIIGGRGQITGNFTVESANNLAIVLRAGALPAKLNVIEERTVGAELGADSIQAGSIAAIVGYLCVFLLILLCYGRFGVYANIALFINSVITLALMVLIGATMTLPGIAGLILSLGMSIDANVLIYERMREETANGKPPVSAIDAGYNRAMSAIIDSNLTSLLACLILFWLGSGPVRGFAVTLGIGIAVSMFTAIMVTRLMVVRWLRRTKPKVLPI